MTNNYVRRVLDLIYDDKNTKDLTEQERRKFCNHVRLALDKQIPRKVDDIASFGDKKDPIGSCSFCTHSVSGNYCSYCGWKLDWEMEEEK